ncbi:tRNA(Ile)-lysidine synthetase-like protein [Bacillus pakistanensis]|uniref:tRNA(Ile)-lysidine synthase n=1 Tax=Rossellomorea pakistanensis TaxID=992288 RepID=A0ABS2NK25_9BACI|nr:tRNA(Ile)-lysidine synthetase-like protein [Bacillus pakistanensis]
MLVYEKAIRHFIKENQLIEKGDKLLVGVSGGPDSLSLLHFLQHSKNEYGISIVAVHVDHMFRGQESYEDLKFVERVCDKYKIPFHYKRINISEKMKHRKGSLQESARYFRYSFFQEVMASLNANKLVLGHHGDDQIETILMRLTRGSSGMSRAGIPVKRPFANGLVIRPLLSMNKNNIEEYCDIYGLDPRRDPSNNKNDYTRNRFRNKVLPFLKEENPLVHEQFQKFSKEILEDELFLQELTVKKLNNIWNKLGNKVTIDIILFNRMPLPLQRRAIHLILNYLYKDVPSSLTFVHTKEILEILHKSGPTITIDLPEGLKFTRSYQEGIFHFDSLNNVESFFFVLEEDKEVVLPNQASIMVDHSRLPHYDDLHVMKIKKESVSLPIIVRSRQPGDRMKLKGLNGTKKVKDIFIDEKVPLHLRDQWPIVQDSNGVILWIPGLKKSVLDTSEEAESIIILHYKQ